jgi:hypothetical protein
MNRIKIAEDIFPKFRLKTTTQIAAFLTMLSGNKISCNDLYLLLYFTDREMLLKERELLTFDHYVFTKVFKKEKIIPRIVHRMVSAPRSNVRLSYWWSCFQKKEDQLKLIRPIPTENLSVFLMKHIIDTEHKYRWVLGEQRKDMNVLIKGLPEHKHMKKGKTISFFKILEANRISKKDILTFQSDLAEERYLEQKLGIDR